jgi:hypothetical protein
MPEEIHSDIQASVGAFVAEVLNAMFTVWPERKARLDVSKTQKYRQEIEISDVRYRNIYSHVDMRLIHLTRL